MLFLGLTLAYAIVVPTGESPDEPSHLQCIEQVSIHRRLPIIDPEPRGDIWWARERIISGLVCAHMPAYYLVSGYTQRAIGQAFDIPIHYEFPPNNPKWATGESLAMFVHREGILARAAAQPATLSALRIQSALFGLIVLTATYIVARQLTTDPRAAIVAVTLTAGWPQFVFMSRAITNDGLATAFASCTIAALMATRHPRKYVIASLFSALAIFSKLTMVYTAAVVMLSYVIETRQAEDSRPYLLSGLAGLCIFGLLAGSVLLHPTLRSHLEWSQRTLSGSNPTALTGRYWLDVLHASAQSGWARFGWMNVHTHDGPAYIWWGLLTLGSGLGLYRILRGPSDRSQLLGWQCCAWLCGVAAIYLRINIDRFQPQFRYAFAGIPVIAGLTASSAEALLLRLRRKKHPSTVVIIVAATLLLLNVWLIGSYIIPAYR